MLRLPISKATPRPNDQRALSDSEVDFAGQFNPNSSLAPKSKQGTKCSLASRGLYAAKNKSIDSSPYDVHNEKLPAQTGSTRIISEGFPGASADGFTRLTGAKITDHHQTTIASDLTKLYGGDEPYIWGDDSVLTTEVDGETLPEPSIALAVSLSHRQSYSPQLMHSSPKASEGPNSQASYPQPLFSSSQASLVYDRRRPAFLEDIRPASALLPASTTATSLHECFEKGITKNAVVLCEE